MNPFAFPTGMAGAMGGGASASTTATASADTSSRNSKQKSKTAESSSDPNFGGLGTLGVAASQAASLGMNQASKLLTLNHFLRNYLSCSTHFYEIFVVCKS